MTPEIENAFAEIRSKYGADSIERVEEMLDSKKSERHPLQQGAKWIMPGISQQPWHDAYGHAEHTPFIEALEKNHGSIKSELEATWAARREAFSNYEHYLTPQDDWQALYLYRKGGLVAESATAAPTAYQVLKDFAVDTEKICPLLECHFSTLLPGAAIKPHCDLWNFSINLHLAVDIPEGCGIKVAGETRGWEEGKCLLFDYSFEHEAWNSGTRPRTCLLVDLWHPDTTVPERAALVALITEIRKLMGED
ncbi:aspartyl/asparaginyl beta-hydroxylase domain-containing protein [Streptomyces sp. 796.1]|uniref:aspartyl/asparaginyl beta-hydroxylase domain-containing protein n=1 Tax=Streptomyces sp. 796.1 TaxID=3163029 RepID=UPI0039C8CE9C